MDRHSGNDYFRYLRDVADLSAFDSVRDMIELEGVIPMSLFKQQKSWEFWNLILSEFLSALDLQWFDIVLVNPITGRFMYTGVYAQEEKTPNAIQFKLVQEVADTKYYREEVQSLSSFFVEGLAPPAGRIPLWISHVPLGTPHLSAQMDGPFLRIAFPSIYELATTQCKQHVSALTFLEQLHQATGEAQRTESREQATFARIREATIASQRAFANALEDDSGFRLIYDAVRLQTRIQGEIPLVRLLRYFAWLEALPLWTHYLYLPLPSLSNRTGAIVLALGGENRDDEIKAAVGRSQSSLLILAKRIGSVAENSIRRFAEKSAVAGIMARNLSHNIGSHVLAAHDLIQQDTSVSQVVTLHTFLQQRLDFIAQIVTEADPPIEPMVFFGDVMGGLFSQYLLLDHLIKDRGYEDLLFTVKCGTEKYTFVKEQWCEHCKRGNACECGSRSNAGAWVIKGNEAVRDFVVGIRGGVVGAHALYMILENIMRNSALHGKRSADRKYQMTLKIVEEAEEYAVEVWDNLSVQENHSQREDCNCVVCSVSKLLAADVLDPSTGRLQVESRGLHEMKACAAMLKADPNDDDSPIVAFAMPDQEQMCLAYRFSLPRPRLVGVVSGEPVSPEASKAGVHQYSEIGDLCGKGDQLGVIDCLTSTALENALHGLAREQRSLPYRLLIVAPAENEEYKVPRSPLLGTRIQLLSRAEYSLLRQRGDWREVAFRLLEAYLRLSHPLGNGLKWELAIAIDRPRDHEVFRRWKRRLDSFSSEILDIHVLHVPKAGSGWTVEAATSNLTKTQLSNRFTLAPEQCILFDNHGRAIDVLGIRHRSDLRFYQTVGTENVKMWNLLESPPSQSAAFAQFALSLLEAGLTRILIVDERVAAAALNLKDGGEFRRALQWANCQPIFSVIGGDRSGTKIYLSKQLENLEEDRDQKLRLPKEEGLDLRMEKATVACLPSDRGAGINCVSKVDVLVIHQTVINMLHDRGFWADATVDRLYQLSASVIITSGRGYVLKHVPAGMPFVEFSVVRENTYGGLSKYHLTRSLLSASCGRKR